MKQSTSGPTMTVSRTMEVYSGGSMTLMFSVSSLYRSFTRELLQFFGDQVGLYLGHLELKGQVLGYVYEVTPSGKLDSKTMSVDWGKFTVSQDILPT